MYKFAIVEDNEAAAEKLAGFLERYANENNEVFEIIKFHDALDLSLIHISEPTRP